MLSLSIANLNYKPLDPKLVHPIQQFALITNNSGNYYQLMLSLHNDQYLHEGENASKPIGTSNYDRLLTQHVYKNHHRTKQQVEKDDSELIEISKTYEHQHLVD